MNPRAAVLLLLLATLLLAGCASSPSQRNDECAYSGCSAYDVNVDINGWDIIGPFLLMAFGGVALGFVIYFIVKTSSEPNAAPAEEEVETEQP